MIPPIRFQGIHVIEIENGPRRQYLVRGGLQALSNPFGEPHIGSDQVVWSKIAVGKNTPRQSISQQTGPIAIAPLTRWLDDYPFAQTEDAQQVQAAFTRLLGFIEGDNDYADKKDTAFWIDPKHPGVSIAQDVFQLRRRLASDNLNTPQPETLALMQRCIYHYLALGPLDNADFDDKLMTLLQVQEYLNTRRLLAASGKGVAERLIEFNNQLLNWHAQVPQALGNLPAPAKLAGILALAFIEDWFDTTQETDPEAHTVVNRMSETWQRLHQLILQSRQWFQRLDKKDTLARLRSLNQHHYPSADYFGGDQAYARQVQRYHSVLNKNLAMAQHQALRALREILQPQRTTPSLKFSALDSDGDHYHYQAPGFNGLAASQFVLDQLGALQAQRPQTPLHVLDLGSGDGRNTLAMLENGYQVTALDQSPHGHKLAQQSAHGRHIALDKAEFITGDILGDSFTLPPGQFDAIVMEHVSQHFSVAELGKILKRLQRALKPNGLMVFDALIATNKAHLFIPGIIQAEPLHLNDKKRMIFYHGFASFIQREVTNTARSQGFEVVTQTPYEEHGPSRAVYVDKTIWGGDKPYEINYELDNRPQVLRFDKPLPVTLQWFVLRKKTA